MQYTLLLQAAYTFGTDASAMSSSSKEVLEVNWPACAQPETIQEADTVSGWHLLLTVLLSRTRKIE